MTPREQQAVLSLFGAMLEGMSATIERSTPEGAYRDGYIAGLRLAIDLTHLEGVPLEGLALTLPPETGKEIDHGDSHPDRP